MADDMDGIFLDYFPTTTINHVLTLQEDGQVWSDLNVGNASVPVYFVNGIPYPCDFENGAQGAVGPQGSQGPVGAQGLQGTQGAIGSRGIQGYRGCDGMQGFAGTDGVKGPQGKSGKVGVQGYRGCDGAQGPAGANGVQGPQGRSGLVGPQGPIGAQGPSGVQGGVGFQGPVGNRGVQGPQGVQGVQGFAGWQGPAGKRGAQGAAGIQGVQGFSGQKGAQGAIGESGAKGERGTQGGVGPRGEKGFLGPQGPQGIDGDRGVQGSQGYQGQAGVQGLRGVAGPQGFEGLQGPQGSQGRSGKIGAQGFRGYEGTQGVKGTDGIQGPQGRSGNRGVQGSQGTSGLPGAQGAKGAQGAAGWMGYQGDNGEVGIQGATGERGAIWDDGIRLSGYNTHLFLFENGVFVPRYSTDVMTLRDGAVVRVWLDMDSYKNGIGSLDGKIPIKVIYNGNYGVTFVQVFYTQGDLLKNHITQDDYNTVLDLTYKDGAFYYSGGLIGESSSSETDCVASLTDDITVSGGQVGGYRDGETVTAGTTLQELFERLLTNDVDVVVGAAPKATISLSNGGGIIEVGSSFNGTLQVSLTDGYFESSNTQTYPVSKFNANNNTSNGKLAAGCNMVESGIMYYRNNAIMQNNTVSIQSMPETVYSFMARVPYSRSNNVPKTSGNNNSSVNIPSGSAQTNTVTLSGRYKCYFGITERITASDYNDPSSYRFTTQQSLSSLTSAWLNKDGATTISSIVTTASKPSFVIVVPESWSVTGTKNSIGIDVPIETTWYPQNTIQYTNGSVTTTYRVYVSPSTEICEYKDITLSR